MTLEEIYKEIILEHNLNPQNFYKLEKHTHSACGNNPVCGDQITVFLKLDGNIIKDVSFLSESCAICKASASLMTSLLKGLSVDDATAKVKKIISVLIGANEDDTALQEFGDIEALIGVKKLPARIKCATLSWHAFLNALEAKGEPEN